MRYFNFFGSWLTKISLLCCIFVSFWFVSTVKAQNVAVTDIESYTPETSAMLDVYSTSKGMLIPRLTTLQRTALTSTAVNGLMVYDTDFNSFFYYNGITWIIIPKVTSSVGVGVALFAVVNATGDTIFAVYNDGVKVTVADGTKGSVGGFAVSGRTPTKPGEEIKYFRVTPDSTRIYVDESKSDKGTVGGFAISGRTPTKATGTKFMDMTQKNYFIGHEAGVSITTGLYNSFLGYQAGKLTQSGDENIFIGYQSGLNNVIGDWNTFLGYQAGMMNTGSDNTFIGYKAGNVHQSRGGNVYIGSKAGEFATMGQQNIFIGESAGSYTTDGHTNIFIGLKAGFKSESTWGNIFIGNEAGYKTFGGAGIQGSYNTFIGWQSGYENILGSNNTFLGTLSGMTNTADYNTMIGTESGWQSTTGGRNTYIGYRSGYNNTASETTGSNNTFIGDESGYNNSTGHSDFFGGSSSGKGNTIGYQNVFVGRYSGNDNLGGNRNTFLGFEAGSSNYNGNDNVAIGYDAGSGTNSNNIGRQNTIIGSYSGWKTSSSVSGEAENNSFYGYSSGYKNTIGAKNIFIGGFSGYNNESGINNTFVGFNSGGNYTGSNSVFIGYFAGNTATGDSKLYIGTGTDPLIYGEFINKLLKVNGNLNTVDITTNSDVPAIIGEHNVTQDWGIGVKGIGGYIGVSGESTLTGGLGYRFGVYGYASGGATNYAGYFNGDVTVTGTFSNPSDKNLKKNILPLTESLNKILNLQGVNYEWKSEMELAEVISKKNSDKMDIISRYNFSKGTQVGVIAQDVEKVLPELVSTDADGIKSVDYIKLIPVLIEAIKEQQKQIDELKLIKTENQLLKSELEAIKTELTRQK